jgi:hypothetical protein
MDMDTTKPTALTAPTLEQEMQEPALAGKEVFDYVENFFKTNPNEYEKIKGVLKQLISKFSQDALSHSNFCSLFATPGNLSGVILKIVGLSEKQLAEAFYSSANFFKGHAMHADSYYQTLLLMYYIALKQDDQLMRLYVLTLIYVKIYNGRRITYFPNGCIPEVASYILNNEFRSSHSFRKYRTPFHLVVEYMAPSLDNTYAMRIRNEPFHDTEGLVKIMAQAWARMDQIFMGVQKHYYAAHAAGLKDVQMTTSSDDNNMQEMAEQNSNFDKLADKINRTLLLKKYKLDSENARLIAKHIILPPQYIDEVEKFLNDFTQDDDEGLKHLYESVLTAFNIGEETGICNMHISSYATKISGNQTDPKIGQFKKLVDETCRAIFKDVFTTQVYNQQQKLRKLVITMVLFRMKVAVCKDTRYDAI